MSTIKMALCLLAAAVAYGVVGRMDYEDAVMMENAYKQSAPTDRLKSVCESSKAETRNAEVEAADVADQAADGCNANGYPGVRHVHRN